MIEKAPNKEPNNKIITGEKLDFLEDQTHIKIACIALKYKDPKDFNKDEKIGFELMIRALLQKNKDAINKISKASYSSIMVYHVSDEVKIHAGANIDPDHVHHIKSPENRNCAEKQASLSAAEDELAQSHLDLMFLYRRPENGRKHKPEMLVPCSDCARNQLLNLQSNAGKLVIVLADDKPVEFLTEDNPLNNDHSVSTLRTATGDLYYRVIDSNELPYLKIEKELGAKVAQNEDSPEVINLGSLE